MMWLGRMDIPVAGGPFKRCPHEERSASPRELGMAIVLWDLLNRSGQFQTWADMERTIQTFVGWTDSMTFAHLAGLLAGAGIRSLADVKDVATLERLQAEILRGEFGVQSIRSDWFAQPLGGAARYALPQSFTVLGQKFVPDSWALSQTVFESILWVNENGETNKVQRRVPGALDVGFAVLGNNQVVPDLVECLNGTIRDADRPHAARFRDGLPYQHNLAAVRAVIDLQPPPVWESNLYLGWLACLRELSEPTTDPMYPEVMRTRAWAMKTLNTQLASWTQLRHDTILYAKQSYTSGGDCVYPAGFVEPRLAFWRRLRSTAERAADWVNSLEFSGTYPLLKWTRERGEETVFIPMADIQRAQVEHLRRFAGTVATLESIAETQLALKCMSQEEELFIRNLIEHAGWLGGTSMGARKFDGWYPKLFYRPVWFYDLDSFYFQDNFGANAADQIVADVHTDVPSVVPFDPGSVLHEAVGKVNLLMTAIESGSDRMIFAGPVLSHYEFEVIGSPRRISDEEWREILNGNSPRDIPRKRLEGLEPPGWTRSYLVSSE